MTPEQYLELAQLLGQLLYYGIIIGLAIFIIVVIAKYIMQFWSWLRDLFNW